MREEKIWCDICRKEIYDEYSKRPNNVRYFDIIPVYSKGDIMMYALAVEPTPEEVWCPDCMREFREYRGLKRH